MLSLLLGAAQAAGCVETGEELPVDEAALGFAQDERSSAAEATGSEERAGGEGCSGERVTLPIRELEAGKGLLPGSPEGAGLAPYDLYFHPNNGAHGGWIEGWRLCHQGGDNYVICTGGYAPVRYWNASSCGGTIHDYYPQGWHGWAQTGRACG